MEQVVFLNVMNIVVVVTSGAFIGCLCEELNVKSAEILVIAVALIFPLVLRIHWLVVLGDEGLSIFSY